MVYASGTAFPALTVTPDGAAVPLPLPQPISWAPDGGDGSSSGSSSSSGGGGGGGGGTGGRQKGGVGAGGRVLRPAQGNNGHVFPGLALGCIATGATLVNDDMLLAAAQAIAGAWP